MRKSWLIGLWCCAVCGMLAADATPDVAIFAREQLSEVKPETITLKGNDGWLYSRNELEHLSKGPLVGGAVARTARARKHPDPIPAIVAFNDALKQQNIRLIVVPVPPKLAFQPLAPLKQGDAMVYLKPFYDELRAKGVDVLDLSDDFAKAGVPVYCKQDAHWNPAGIALAAQKVAQQIGLKGDTKFKATEKPVTIVGDLMASLDKNAAPSETLTIREIEGKTFDKISPVLLLSDSHGLVFSAGGDMLAEHAGFGEQLAHELQMPVDRIAVKGSAATAVRVNLYRKAARDPNWLKNKKFVIWLFTCREFTEASNGWVPVPVLKK